MAVHAFHPETGADVVVTEEQLNHMRQSGWLLRSEHEANQAALAAAQAKDDAKAAKAAAKTAGEGN